MVYQAAPAKSHACKLDSISRRGVCPGQSWHTIGVGEQEAFELLQILAFTFYGIAYLAMFAIPLFARKETALRPPLWLRLASFSGFLVTLLFVFLSASPIIPVANQTAYTLKTISVILGANALGFLLYRAGSRKGIRPADE
jgi:hypothetical protein